VDDNISVNQTDARKSQNEDDEMCPDQFEDAAVPDHDQFADSFERILCILVSTGVNFINVLRTNFFVRTSLQQLF